VVEGPVIELLGVGVPRRGAGWLLHRVCATLEAGELTAVVSAEADERLALLDTIAGRRVPDEGRVWIDGVPVMAESLGRVRRLCGDVDPHAGLVEHRSSFWNALAPPSGPRALGRLLRLPRRQAREAALAALEQVGLGAQADEPVAVLSSADRMRVRLARALARRPRHLVVRDPDVAMSVDEVGTLLGLLKLLTRRDRLGIVVSLAARGLGRPSADRVLVLGDGLLLFHGRAEGLDQPRAAWAAGGLTR
jgi:ABC-type phosphate/phosphonate transport system ATPase subunit